MSSVRLVGVRPGEQLMVEHEPDGSFRVKCVEAQFDLKASVSLRSEASVRALRDECNRWLAAQLTAGATPPFVTELVAAVRAAVRTGATQRDVERLYSLLDLLREEGVS